VGSSLILCWKQVWSKDVEDHISQLVPQEIGHSADLFLDRALHSLGESRRPNEARRVGPLLLCEFGPTERGVIEELVHIESRPQEWARCTRGEVFPTWGAGCAGVECHRRNQDTCGSPGQDEQLPGDSSARTTFRVRPYKITNDGVQGTL
jgi:hypothetical protein